MTTIVRGLKYKDIPTLNEPSLPTLNEKFNKWITSYNGFVKGTILYWTGSSGSGKTTFLTSVLNDLPDQLTAVYSREMILEQLKHQLGQVVNHDNVEFIGVDQQPNFKSFMSYLWEVKPSVVVIDSLQVIAELDYPEESLDAGCMNIVKELKEWVDKTGGVVILVGHVNKDNSFAGSNTIMHWVDIHVQMIFDKKTKISMMSFGDKNRKGDKLAKLYYEFMGQGKIELFTPLEYEDRLTLAVKPVSFLDAVQDIIKTYEKFAKGKPKEKEFLDELRVVKSQIKKRVKDNEGYYIGEYVTYLNALINKHEII